MGSLSPLFLIDSSGLNSSWWPCIPITMLNASSMTRMLPPANVTNFWERQSDF
jgi:hypothetical protein